MRRACLLLIALAVSGCSFEEPPPPPSAAGGAVQTPAPPPSLPPVTDPCTDVALTLLDGQLNGLPSAEPAIYDRANQVVKQFVARYDAAIASGGVEAARAQYTDQVTAACTG